jgi:hypothetical protein
MSKIQIAGNQTDIKINLFLSLSLLRQDLKRDLYSPGWLSLSLLSARLQVCIKGDKISYSCNKQYT